MISKEQFVKKFIKERLRHSQWNGLSYLVGPNGGEIRVGTAAYFNVRDGEQYLRGVAELIYDSVLPYFEEQ